MARSTLSDWIAQTAGRFEPIVVAMAKAQLSAHLIYTNDTGLPIFSRPSGYRRDTSGCTPATTRTSSSATRRAAKATDRASFLRGYKGDIQADAANPYDRLYSESPGARRRRWRAGRTPVVALQGAIDELTDKEPRARGRRLPQELYEAEADNVAQ